MLHPKDLERTIACVEKHIKQKIHFECGGESAISLIQNTGLKIDLVILDMTMPIVDGSMVLECIQVERSELAVLLASGYTVDDKAASLMLKGCKGFVQKPFTIEELSQ